MQPSSFFQQMVSGAAVSSDGLIEHTLPNKLEIKSCDRYMADFIYQEIFEKQIYTQHGIEVHAGDCIFDVGANIGLFMLYLHQHHQNLRFYAFEPLPPTFKALAANADQHDLPCTLFNIGLSDTPKEATFSFYPHLSGWSSCYEDPENEPAIRQRTREHIESIGLPFPPQFLDQAINMLFQTQTYTCKLQTLSSIWHEQHIQQIDLLKIDVERSEVDVLRGIEAQHWPNIKQLVMEVHTQELLDQITQILTAHEYVMHIEPFEENFNLYARLTS